MTRYNMHTTTSVLVSAVIFVALLTSGTSAVYYPASFPSVATLGGTWDFSGDISAVYVTVKWFFGYYITGTTSTALISMNMTNPEIQTVNYTFGDYSGIQAGAKPYYISHSTIFPREFSVMIVYRVTDQPASGEGTFLAAWNYHQVHTSFDTRQTVFGIWATPPASDPFVTEYVTLNNSATYKLSGRVPEIGRIGVKIVTVNRTHLVSASGPSQYYNVALNESDSVRFSYPAYNSPHDSWYGFTQSLSFGGATSRKNQETYGNFSGYIAEITHWRTAISLNATSECLDYANRKYGIWATAIELTGAAPSSTDSGAAWPALGVRLVTPKGTVATWDSKSYVNLTIVGEPVLGAGWFSGTWHGTAINGTFVFGIVALNGPPGIYTLRVCTTIDETGVYVATPAFFVAIAVLPPVTIPNGTTPVASFVANPTPSLSPVPVPVPVPVLPLLVFTSAQIVDNTLVLIGTGLAAHNITRIGIDTQDNTTVYTSVLLTSDIQLVSVLPERPSGRVFRFHVRASGQPTLLYISYPVPLPTVTSVSPSILYLYNNTDIVITGSGMFSGPLDPVVVLERNAVRTPCVTTNSSTSGPDSTVRCTVPGPRDTASAANTEWRVLVSTQDGVWTPAGPNYTLIYGFAVSPNATEECTYPRMQLTPMLCGCPYGFTGKDCLDHVVQVTRDMIYTSEDGETAMVRITLHTRPLSRVSMEMYVSNPAESSVEPSRIEWLPLPDTPDLHRDVMVRGLRDSVRDGNISYRLYFAPVQSSDPVFSRSRTPPPLDFINIDSRPRIVVPPAKVVGFNGSELSMVLSDTDSEFTLGIGETVRRIHIQPRGNKLQALTFINDTYACFSETLLLDTNCTLRFNTSGEIAGEGYRDVIITNTKTGTVLVAREAIYFSNICTQANWWGSDGHCMPCPSGGVCPGGKRLWAQPGFWVDSESAVDTRACRPPEDRCAGGRFSGCGEGYTGYICGACAEGYYEDKTRAGACSKCSSDGGYFAGIAANLVLVVVLAACTALLPNDPLGTTSALIGTLQTIYAVGQMAGMYVPYFTGQFYAAMGIFVLNMNINELKCAIPEATTFGITFVVLWLAIGTVLLAGGILLLVCRIGPMRSMALKHVAGRMCMFVAVIFHYMCAQIGMQALYCIHDVHADRLVLLSDTEQTCFTATHWIFSVVSIIVLVACTVGSMGLIWYVISRQSRLVDIYTDGTLLTVAGALYASLRPRRSWFAYTPVVINIILATSVAVGATDPFSSNVIALVVMSLCAVIKLVASPFDTKLELGASVIADIVCVLAASIAVGGEMVSTREYTRDVESAGYILFGLTVILLLMFTVKWCREVASVEWCGRYKDTGVTENNDNPVSDVKESRMNTTRSTQNEVPVSAMLSLPGSANDSA